MLLKKLTIYLIVLMGYLSSSAHSQTEIGFRFIEEDEQTYLEVHLTSLTIFDLLYDLYPYLKSKESLNLNYYVPDYEIYFNKHIDLKLNGSDRSLKFVDSNLATHDAKMIFLVQDLDHPIEKYEVSILGFDFYRKPSYTILFTTPAITETHFLTRDDNTCTGMSPELADRNNLISDVYYQVLMIVIIIGLLVLAAKARKLYVRSLKQLSLDKG